MELVLKPDNEGDVELILAFAKKLNIPVENREKVIQEISDKEVLKQRILSFKAKASSSFGDAVDWEREQRGDRSLSFLR